MANTVCFNPVHTGVKCVYRNESLLQRGLCVDISQSINLPPVMKFNETQVLLQSVHPLISDLIPHHPSAIVIYSTQVLLKLYETRLRARQILVVQFVRC